MTRTIFSLFAIAHSRTILWIKSQSVPHWINIINQNRTGVLLPSITVYLRSSRSQESFTTWSPICIWSTDCCVSIGMLYMPHPRKYNISLRYCCQDEDEDLNAVTNPSLIIDDNRLIIIGTENSAQKVSSYLHILLLVLSRAVFTLEHFLLPDVGTKYVM